MPPRRNLRVLAFLDWQPDPTARIGSFSHTFSYDPVALQFNSGQSSLMCDLRASASDPFCPDATPGSGTSGLAAYISDYTVDQSGLTFAEGTGADGRPAVTATWAAPSDPVSVAGERNFLALAFDLRVPLSGGVSVTYSPDYLADASLTTVDLLCSSPTGAPEACSSSQPTRSLRINNPVPGPLGVGGVGALLWQSRRLRRRCMA